MNEKQEAEWNAAQKIPIGEDLIAASQKQLEFLAAVDRQRWLYCSPGVEGANYRYKKCWLPLLAKHSEDSDLKDPLVVPIDCEWIWHCHRLNPVQYKMDCERLYGRILDCKNVESSICAESKDLSRKIWEELYPDEPYELDYSKISSKKYVDVSAEDSGTITYDLVAAVQRQSTFYYQVSRPFTQDPRFLAEALARYKGFLYLLKSNQVKSLQEAIVPTYDIDIMWHSHQLCPVSYCKDQIALLGEVLQHDDTDSDRSVGKKLHNGFMRTTKQFEETFGLRYWRAGAMYRGPAPTPLTTVPLAFNSGLKVEAPSKSCKSFLSFPPLSSVEVFLEIVDVKGAQMQESETLYVFFTKKQPDMYFSGDGTLSILSVTGKKNVESFQCEPTGDMILTLIAKSNPNSQRILGTTSISLEELTSPNSKLLIEKWFQLSQNSLMPTSAPICLRVAISSTLPLPSSLIMNMVRLSDESCLPSSFFPLHVDDNSGNYSTSFVDAFGNPIIWVQIRDIVSQKKRTPDKEVVAVTKLLRTPLVLAVNRGNEWLFTEASKFSGTAEIKACPDGTYHCELTSDQVIKLYWGKKLEYEDVCCESHNHDCASITAVEFSDKHPYGKAIATFDMNSKIAKVNEEWFILPWTTLSSVFMAMESKTASNGTPGGPKCLNGVSGNLCAMGFCSAPCGCSCYLPTNKNSALYYAYCIHNPSPAAGKTNTTANSDGRHGTLCFATCVDRHISARGKMGANCLGDCLPGCFKPVSKGSACGATCGTKCQPACLTGK